MCTVIRSVLGSRLDSGPVKTKSTAGSRFESTGQPRFGCGSMGQILVRNNFGQLWSTLVNIKSTAVNNSQTDPVTFKNVNSR
ncbi:hypothetical protein HanPSC8_Chr16g0704871 [Helianthus annuus]|nr:hypothetical protein HanPSC8_Chr16g0704871 [Helianthus annuus]